MFDREIREMFASGQNPIFEYERRKIPWIKDISSPTQFSIRAWVTGALIVFMVWLIAGFVIGNDSSVRANSISFLIYASLVIMIVVDLYNVFIVASNLRRHLSPEHWELIRTTGQSEDCIFDALYALAQIRTWRSMSLEVALRIGIIEIFLLEIFREPIDSISGLVCFLFLLFVLTAVIYVVEPIWRMKALTAFSIAVVTITKNRTVEFLTLFGVIAFIHLLQIASLVGSLYIFLGWSNKGDPIAVVVVFFFCALPIDVISAICLTYVLYRFLKKLSLNVAFKRMFAPTD